MKHVHYSYLPFLVPILALLAALPGCSRRTAPPTDVGNSPAASRPAENRAPVRVRFAYQDRVVDAVPIVAVANKYFEDQGLEVKASRFTNGPACSEALLSGAADIGTMGDATAVIAAARKTSGVTIIASHGNGEHRHRIMVAPTSAIHSPADLVGKKLAVKKGTSTYGGLLQWARRQKLDLKKVDVIDLRPGDMPEALSSGAVDAIVASEPTPSQIEAKHLGRQLATLGGLGNTYPVMLVVRNRFLEAHPDAVVAFLRALRKGAAFLKERRSEAVQLVADASGLPPKVAAAAMSRHEYALRLDASIRKSLDQTARFLHTQETIEELPDWTKTLSDQWLKKAEVDSLK